MMLFKCSYPVKFCFFETGVKKSCCINACFFPGDIHVLVDHFLDIFHESTMFKMQATLIINEIMLGTTGDNGKLKIQLNLF